MRGRNVCSYHSVPLRASPIARVKNPASSGMPKKMSTDLAMAQIDTCRAAVSRPNQPGSTER